MFRSLLLPLAAVLLVLPAAADARTPPDEPPINTEVIAGYGGATVWVSDDLKVLVRRDGETRETDVKWMNDLDVGPDADGDPVAVYTRCGERDCDLHRLDLETLEEEPVAAASHPRAVESSPTVWRGTVAFLRDKMIVTADLDARSTPRPVMRWDDDHIDMELGDGFFAYTTETRARDWTGESAVVVRSLDGRVRRPRPLTARLTMMRGASFGALQAERDGLWLTRKRETGCDTLGVDVFRLGHRTAQPRRMRSGAPLAVRRAFVPGADYDDEECRSS